MARTDRSFAERLSGKSIDDCVTYILNTVMKSGINGFADEEIFSMAVHFIVEDGIDPGDPVDCSVVVNHTVELSEEERRELREKARMQFFSEEMARRRSATRRERSEDEDEPNLFNIATT